MSWPDVPSLTLSPWPAEKATRPVMALSKLMVRRFDVHAQGSGFVNQCRSPDSATAAFSPQSQCCSPAVSQSSAACRHRQHIAYLNPPLRNAEDEGYCETGAASKMLSDRR